MAVYAVCFTKIVHIDGVPGIAAKACALSDEPTDLGSQSCQIRAELLRIFECHFSLLARHGLREVSDPQC